MVSSRMLRLVALVTTDISEEPSASFIMVTRIGEIGITLAPTSNRSTLRRNTKSVLTRATRRNIPEDIILHSHRRENLKSYKHLHVTRAQITLYVTDGRAVLLVYRVYSASITT
jgi:hypothetical protein